MRGNGWKCIQNEGGWIRMYLERRRMDENVYRTKGIDKNVCRTKRIDKNVCRTKSMDKNVCTKKKIEEL